MHRLHEPSDFDEAQESLRVIRDIMERSTRHASLSGLAGILIGIWSILGVIVTKHFLLPNDSGTEMRGGMPFVVFSSIWAAVFVVCGLTDIVLNKRRAAKVGKKVFSPLGKRIVQAVGPSFVAGIVLTALFAQSWMRISPVIMIFDVWMVLYGLAGCAVGLFSAKAVSVLGWAFLLTGLFGICAGPRNDVILMAISFGGYHIAYGLYTGITRGDW